MLQETKKEETNEDSNFENEPSNFCMFGACCLCSNYQVSKRQVLASRFYVLACSCKDPKIPTEEQDLKAAAPDEKKEGETFCRARINGVHDI